MKLFREAFSISNIAQLAVSTRRRKLYITKLENDVKIERAIFLGKSTDIYKMECKIASDTNTYNNYGIVLLMARRRCAEALNNTANYQGGQVLPTRRGRIKIKTKKIGR